MGSDAVTVAAPSDAVVPLGGADSADARPTGTGVAEFDRVMAGGLVPGSITLLSGPPGVGKSTLALQIAVGVATAGTAVLYVSAEEALAQVRLRAGRVAGDVPEAVSLTDVTDVGMLGAIVERDRPGLVIIDSIQTVSDPGIGSVPGSVGQVRGCAQRLAAVARSTGACLLVVGHVTKDGQVAGPRQLEHLVDTVVAFDADADQGLRFLRATKHRFGPVGELGVFRMDQGGMSGVPDAAGLFLRDRIEGVAGSTVAPVLDGRRVIVTEVQALTGTPGGPPTVQLAQGLDRARLGLVVAVLARRIGLEGDVFCSVAGGVRVADPGADLAVAVAVGSASSGLPVRAGTAVCGELGLVGEIRRVRAIGERVREVARLGFERVIVPVRTPADTDIRGIEVVRVATVVEALDAALVGVVPSLRGPDAQPAGSDAPRTAGRRVMRPVAVP